MKALHVAVAVVAMALLATGTARAQSGIQWSQRPDAALERAREMDVPLMFWVTKRAKWDDEDAKDLRDAQDDSFRESIVAMIAERYFVPCRVTQNSKVLATAEKLGVDITSENYIAIVTASGRLLDQIDPAQVASPEALAERLAAASRAHREAVYEGGLKETIANPQAAKSAVRTAVQAVWRLRIYGADAEIAGLLKRTDLTPPERQRVYKLLGAMGTPECTRALLDAAGSDQEAASALARADVGALPTLLEALPAEEGEVTKRNIAAYRGAAALTRSTSNEPDDFWTKATPQQRAAALERLKTRAEAVYDAWYEREGRWRWGAGK